MQTSVLRIKVYVFMSAYIEQKLSMQSLACESFDSLHTRNLLRRLHAFK